MLKYLCQTSHWWHRCLTDVNVEITKQFIEKQTNLEEGSEHLEKLSKPSNNDIKD